MDISPGSTVRIAIAATPRGQAALKTLRRICARDAEVRKRQRQRKRKRPARQEWIRGGKYWHHQMRSKPPIRLDPGQRYTIRATADVIRDLQSVARFIKISAS